MGGGKPKRPQGRKYTFEVSRLGWIGVEVVYRRENRLWSAADLDTEDRVTKVWSSPVGACQKVYVHSRSCDGLNRLCSLPLVIPSTRGTFSVGIIPSPRF